LSVDTDATIPVYLPGIQTDVRLTREEFESMIRPRIRETIQALERAAKSAGLGFEGIDRILLVGGSSRIPLVAEMVRDATQRPVALDAHPKHTMALGAAWVAEQSRLSQGASVATAGAGTLPPPAPVSTVAAGPVVVPPVVAPPAPSGAASRAPATPVAASPAPAPPAPETRRRRVVPVAIAGAAVLVVAVAAGAFALLRNPSTPSGSPSQVAVSVTPSPAGVSPSIASISPSPSPASPTPVPPSPSPTWGPGRQSRIDTITIRNGVYIVDYEIHGYAITMPGPHVHFFWNTIAPTKAGRPAPSSNWYVWFKPNRFDGYRVADRPGAATQLCVLVANMDHSVRQNTGNCVDLPSA
jgi:hypothetical protein